MHLNAFIASTLTACLLGFTASTAAERSFEFIKIDSTGKKLPFKAKQWACVKDKSSGLTWEKKTEQGLSNADFIGTFHNNTAYINIINHQKLCGYDDWRLPELAELQALGRIRGTDSHLNTDFFPNAFDYWYWTGTPNKDNAEEMWLIRSEFGFIKTMGKNQKQHIRLVRD